MEAIGKRISNLRKNKNLTQNDLSEQLYVTHQAISKWENGKSLPSIEILYEMTKLFNVSIDFLLDDTEIDHSDYQSMFRNMERDVVIGKYLQSNTPDSELPNIFYLLNQHERNLILSLIINEKLDVTITTIWTYLNDKERKYVLSVILSGKLKCNIQNIYHQLSDHERHVVNYHDKNGIYKLTSKKIRSENNEKE